MAEGVRTTEELLRSQLRIRGALISPELAAAPRGSRLREALVALGLDVHEVDETSFRSASDTESPQGVLAIAEIPERTLANLQIRGHARVLVLDAIQDPGNAGTLLRTAAALGATATLALPGTVDLWNSKVVRSAMGALFLQPAYSCTWNEADVFLSSNGIELWAADAAGEVLAGVTSAAPARLAIAVGNEGAGLSADARRRVSRTVAIPVSEEAESLNVAVAAGILLYSLRP